MARSSFKNSFKTGFSEERKSKKAPRGFDANHPKVEWLKCQGFYVWKSYKVKEYTAKNFFDLVAKDAKQALRLNMLLDMAIEGRWPSIMAQKMSKKGVELSIDDTVRARRQMDF